jgi:Rrf2 family protein
MAANSRLAMATHLMVALAIRPEEKTSSEALAESLNTNPVVVRRIVSDLKNAGLIVSRKGRDGGVQLKKTPTQISLYEIYLAVESGVLFAYNPNDPNRKCPLSCRMKSALQPAFDQAEKSLAKGLKQIKLSELVSRVSQ